MLFSEIMPLSGTMLVLAAGEAPPGGGLWSMLPMLGGMFLLMYFILMRPEAQKRKKRQAMLNQLKKNDRIVTTGGVVGTIVDVRDEEIGLKIDENNNVKIRVHRWAVHEVLTESAGDRT